MKKILLGLLGLIVFIVIGFLIYINLSWRKDYSQQYPLRTDITIKSDSATIARGKYLVYGPAHCAHCHVPFEQLANVEQGQEVALTGGFGLDIPPGLFMAPNITTDEETGIGGITDAELYRMLRHNVRPNGMAAIDFMPFINMSEEDINAIIAYLRSTEPVKSTKLNSEYSFLGKMIMTFGLIKPGIPEQPVPMTVSKDSTASYGEYMANAVANCRGCHTDRDMQTGEFIGPDYAGGMVFGPDNLTNNWLFTAPNLTPDKETGLIASWTEDQFIARMKKGRIYDYSPMPWAAFASMDITELKAIYRYLNSLDPVNQEVEQLAVAPGESE